ncbi:hypothetical protein POM88_028327 [Heracleum sosnowskyi]|uniref:Uncharacterized protein n=1 Tax=Heracleum sosnowskyi TaxID=360622 RepID=A0AAD8IBW3_9APIA|nr:hypothetical protein POM88_028327 [Heracleum sosnowskyi]
MFNTCQFAIVDPSGFPTFLHRATALTDLCKDCGSGHRRSRSRTSSEQKIDITDSFSQMILQFHDVYDPKKMNVKIKLVSGSPYGAAAEEAKRSRASWVVLDKHLRQK